MPKIPMGSFVLRCGFLFRYRPPGNSISGTIFPPVRNLVECSGDDDDPEKGALYIK